MPLPKPLRQSKHSGSSSQPRRNICKQCHNLDPRGHTSSVCESESSKEVTSNLTLILDALQLQRTKETTDGGCRFCRVLIKALDNFFDDWKGFRGRIILGMKEKGTIKISIDGNTWRGKLIEIYAESASRAPWPALGHAHHIPANAGSDPTFNFARRCIQDCLTNPKHVACKPPSKALLTMPKRLLDVGRVRVPIRIIDTQGKTFEYATLSHCWGTGPLLKATKAKWSKLVSNIPFDALPPLFQDAIIITRQLGIRYIWIDSLCIIQDSSRDWETESAKMGAIYENSYVTISATDSGDSNTRCLVDRRKAIKIPYENTAKKEFELRARLIQDHHPDTVEREPARPAGHLMTRAWALQEHTLSTRILHYTATELLFECKTSYRCECLPSRKTYPTTPSIIPKAITKRSKDLSAVWDAWQRVVEQYSKRDLTVASDKLPAISGVAAKIKDATGSSYLAGLWKDNLATDLLWSSISSPSDLKLYALEKYRGPTFSWASLNAPVSYYAPDTDERESFKSTIKLHSSSVALGGLNPLGAVFDASIRLCGPCLPALLSSNQKEGGSWEYVLLVRGTSAIPVSNDCLLHESEIVNKSGNSEKTVRRALIGAEMSVFKTPVLCLGVAKYDAWMSGLILGQSERVLGAWERLGTFSAGMEGFGKAEEQVVTIV
ncbi:HET-domain-containing protein [Amniculicola lignicola CBS 123094]|uniref:HET-domain-containing protein n=1 Tax=Amniculicola lignicola CBS 123094 TaxID=1392246 RepID=A0A6A5WL45_9PLEO|nr:HET-domain-containing protein [Amniculicola lignicola CBS 123094]